MKKQIISKKLYEDLKNHFVGMGRMTLAQFKRWIKNDWKHKKLAKK